MEREQGIAIPRDLFHTLFDQGNAANNILCVARSDMNLESTYGDGYIVLTNEEMMIAKLPYNQKKVRSFGGYQDVVEDNLEKRRNWTIERYPIEEIDRLDIQMLVSGGMLHGSIQGMEKQLSAFTNSCMGEMKQLTKLFGRRKEGKEIEVEEIGIKDREDCCPTCGARYPNKDRKICPKCMDRRSILVRTFAYFKPYRLKIVILMGLYIATAALNLVWPYLNGTILYDKVLAKDAEFARFVGMPGGTFAVILGGLVITMILTSLTTQLIGMLQGVLTAKIVPDVVKEIKTQVFRSMGKLSVGFYSKRQTGGLMTRVLDDAERVTDFYINGLPYFFIHLLTMIFISIVMFSMNWKLALASLVLLPFLTLVSIKMLPRLWHHYGRRHRASRSLNAQVNDNITGARVVKAFGQEESELNRFGKYNNRVKQVELSLVAYDNRYNALYTTVENLSSFIVMGLGAYLVLSNTAMEIGVLITFIGYVNQMKGPLNFMSRVFRWWAESINCAQRIFEIIDAVPEVQESTEPVSLETMRGDITLNHVTFGYEAHKPVLKDISFHVEAGKMLGIVGRSGAGKSTLVNLISRLYDVQEGEILIDGVNVKDLKFQDLHKNIAMVSQETYIFMGTVAQNIAYARPEASTEEIIRAAVLASAHDFICRMPDGYDTMIGSSGRELSGGERQRISIARAILADPKILILDEATASVDTETEQAIQSSLSYLVQGRTTLSIAHRLSTLKDADRLVVIDNGALTESGTHEELIQLEGTYYTLMELQTKALAMRGIE